MSPRVERALAYLFTRALRAELAHIIATTPTTPVLSLEDQLAALLVV